MRMLSRCPLPSAAKVTCWTSFLTRAVSCERVRCVCSAATLAINILKEPSVEGKQRSISELRNWLTATKDAPESVMSEDDFKWMAANVPETPSLPDAPRLLSPTEMAKPRGVPINVYLLHSIAHIELNAVHLYVDTCARFCQTVDLHGGVQLFRDCIKIATEEAMHFSWLDGRLRALGSFYGAQPAHTGLWDDATKTRSSLSSRIAAVSLVHEARALDSEDRLVQKLKSAQDAPSAELVRKIIADEVEHVRVGMHWFQRTAKAATDLGDEAGQKKLFQRIVSKTLSQRLSPPFNVSTRARAGMPQDWYIPER